MGPMTTPHEDSPVPDVNAYPYGYGGKHLLLTKLGAETLHSSSGHRIVEQAERPPLTAGDIVTFGQVNTPVPARPVSQLRGTRDYGQVLHQIRALLVSAVFALAVCVLLLASIADDLDNLANAAPQALPTQAVLTLAGDPAPDYMAHVVLADGSERDVQLGAHLLDSPVRITLHANSPADGTSSCLIELDGAPVVSETAQNGGTATCEWRADA